MNEVIRNLLTRRSVRSFTEEHIKREDLDLIIKTALSDSLDNLITVFA